LPITSILSTGSDCLAVLVRRGANLARMPGDVSSRSERAQAAAGAIKPNAGAGAKCSAKGSSDGTSRQTRDQFQVFNTA